MVGLNVTWTLRFLVIAGLWGWVTSLGTLLVALLQREVSMFRDYLLLSEKYQVLSFHEALSWVKSLQLHYIYFETDCLNLVNAFGRLDCDDSGFGLVLEYCKSLFKDIGNAHLMFVKRSANHSTHLLAKAVGSLSDLSKWYSHPPNFLADVLAQDLSHY